MTKHSAFRCGVCVLSALLAAHTTCDEASAAETQNANRALAKPFDIPAGNLAPALNRFAEQGELSLVYPASLTAGLVTQGVSGDYVPLDALDRLLAGTGISARITGDKTVALERAPAPSETTVLMPTTKVTADALEDDVFDKPRSVTHIGREDIDKVAARHISVLLEQMPGVYSVTNEQNPSVSVSVRGLKDFGRINMNIDGVRQDYQLSGHQQRNGEMFVDSELLAGVDVEKGPSSELGGAGVLGGVATFHTLGIDDVLDTDQTVGGRLRSSTGTNGNAFVGSVTSGWRITPELDVFAAYSHKNLDEYEPGTRGEAVRYPWLESRGVELEPGVVNLTDQTLSSELIKARWRPAQGHELQLTALNTNVEFAQSSFMNTDAAYAYYVSCGGGTVQNEFCNSLNYDPNNLYPQTSASDVRSSSFALDYDWDTGGRWLDAHAKLYYADTHNRQNGGDSATPYRLDTTTETWGGALQNISRFSIGPLALEWKYGGEIFFDQTHPSAESSGLDGEALGDLEGGTPEGRRWLGGGFSTLVWDYQGWLRFIPGIRYDRYRVWGHTGFPGSIRAYEDIRVDHRAGALSPTAALAVSPLDGLQFFTSYGRGWRPPAITETLISGAHPADVAVRYYPNYLLEPERIRQWEVGANVKRDGLSAKIAYFRSRIENYIFLGDRIALPGRGPALTRTMFVNSEELTRFRGIELSLRYGLRTWRLGVDYTRISRDGSFSYLTWPLGGSPSGDNGATYELGGGYYNPAPPPSRIVVDSDVRILERAQLGARLTCASKGEPPYDGYIENNGFCALDLYSRIEASSRLSLGLNLKNVTQREYIMAMGDSFARTYAPGRTILGSLQYKF